MSEVLQLGKRMVRAARLGVQCEHIAQEVDSLNPDDRVRLIWFVSGARFADKEPCLMALLEQSADGKTVTLDRSLTGVSLTGPEVSLTGPEGASSTPEGPVSEPRPRPRIDWPRVGWNLVWSLILVLAVKVFAGDQDANRDPASAYEAAETLRTVGR